MADERVIPRAGIPLRRRNLGDGGMQGKAEFAGVHSRDYGAEAWLHQFENCLDLNRRAGGELGETQRAAGVVAVAVLAKDRVEQIRGAVDHEVLVRELQGRIHTAEHFDHPQTVERAMGLPGGTQDFLRAVLRRGVALLDGETRAEFALGLADVTGREELIAAADAEVEIAGGDFLEFEAEALGGLLWRHGAVCSGDGLGRGNKRLPHFLRHPHFAANRRHPTKKKSQPNPFRPIENSPSWAGLFPNP